MEQARRLIAENLRTQNPFLDLGNCGLTDLCELPELFDCVHLETLILSNKWIKNRAFYNSNNKGIENNLTHLSPLFKQFTKLNKLVSAGYWNKKWEIGGISALKELNNLTYLDLSYTQISDISVLKELKNLTNLDLHNNQISDISVLKDLKGLTNLDLHNNQISDISVLKDLKGLTNLDLRNNQISDISTLKKLAHLTNLNLLNNRISDISVLKELKELKSLDLDSNRISDISVLKELNELTNLYLDSNGISDISTLKKLPHLTNLYLNSNQISDISVLKELKGLTDLSLKENQLSDISALKELKGLTNLDLSENQLSDISALKELNNLTYLDLSYTQLSDISALKELKGLTNLFLWENQISDISTLKELKGLTTLILWNNQISDISVLKELKGLTNLNLSENQISDISILKELTDLTHLNLSENQIQYIPKEIYEREDCAKELKNYWQEIEKSGSEINNQLKVMFLGNGCVGKTTLLHWFIDNGFKDIPQDRRTEGIIIKSLPLIDGTVFANFWDFGGQEVYHATHRLFLGKRTLYLLVWASETSEKENEQRHPPHYWLDMIADIQGKQERSTVLIIQNLMGNQLEKNMLSDDELADYHQRGLDINRLTVNAKAGKNIKTFKAQVEEAVENILQCNIEELPKTWIKIRRKIVEHKENKEKTIDWAVFLQICSDCQLATSPGGVIDYLHRAGEVFYYKNQFDNKIILDQEWALDKVYAVLKAKNIARYKGIFQLEDLIEIWQTQDSRLTSEETKVFLNFMLENKLMFYTEGYENHKRKEEFVIPQLLTEQKPVTLNFFSGQTKYRIEYASLHRDIIERFIVSTAHLSKEKAYWRNGLYLSYQDSDALIEVVEKEIIEIQCVGNQQDMLLQKIREEFHKIRPLEKAKEYTFEKETWQLKTERRNMQEKENFGFPAVQKPIFNTDKKFAIMGALKEATEFITDVFNNTAVKKFKDDFVTATVDWIRPLFLEEDKKLVEKLESNPTDAQTQSRLATKLEDLLEKDDFRAKMLELLEKSKENKASINNSAAITGNENINLQGLQDSTVTININKGGSEHKA